MTNSLDSRADGSLALFIDGDLQFDSSDESIYHEGLVLPALATSLRRTPADIRVLILGGGDGLSAREVFKCTRVSHVDLVDYDAEIVAMAKSEFKELNQSSFEDPRLDVHVRDAWQFVSEAVENKISYDLIICDLTVAADVDSARFHSIDWYTMLSRLTSESGVIAVNAVSPDATPQAFWSIFNGLAQSGWHARPYHVSIPSFSARGYGSDWGFFVAAKTPVSSDEIDICDLPEPRTFLTGNRKVKDLFLLPLELFDLQQQSSPALSGSAILLRYFNSGKLVASSGITRDALKFDTTKIIIPPADTGKELLPPEVSLAFAKMLDNYEHAGETERPSPETMFSDILGQFPALQQSHAPELVADFLKEPIVFLQGIDLRGLIGRMLQHASALPARFVEELKALASELEESESKLQEFASEHLSPQQLGTNAVMLLTLVLVVGNLLYPDMVYAKGGHSGHAGYYGRGGGGYWNNYGGTTTEYIKKRPKTVNVVQPMRKTPDLQIQNSGGGKIKGLVPDRKLNGELARDLTATMALMLANRAEANEHLAMLRTELKSYENSQSEEVLYGMHMLPRVEAIRRAQESLRKVNLKLQSIESQIAALTIPDDTAPDTTRGS